MAKKIEAKEISVKGNKLECPICKNDKFWPKETLMNTPGLTFLVWNGPIRRLIIISVILVAMYIGS
jgi:hypothetical protein